MCSLVQRNRKFKTAQSSRVRDAKTGNISAPPKHFAPMLMPRPPSVESARQVAEKWPKGRDRAEQRTGGKPRKGEAPPRPENSNGASQNHAAASAPPLKIKLPRFPFIPLDRAAAAAPSY
jgi:hypothetical protein